VLPPTTGIVGLALVSVALAMIAYAIDVEALGTTAALGAFFAPLLLGRDYADADLLLLYLACMAAGLGLVAGRRRWRLTTFVVALSFFGVAYAGAADRGTPWGVLLYGVLGGGAGIYVGLRERWWETRFLSFTGGWTFVAAASRHFDHPWAILLAGVVLAAPVWWFALRTTSILPSRAGEAPGMPGWSVGEAIYFLLTPFFHSLQYLAFVYKMEDTRLRGLQHPEIRGTVIAFATILAVVAGLTISASTSFAHDFWTNVLHHGRERREGEEVRVARVTAFFVGAISIGIAIVLGPNANVAFLVALAFAVAASANLPTILYSLFWKRFNTQGALWSIYGGLVVCLVLIIFSPAVSGETTSMFPTSHFDWFPLANPGLVSIPVSFVLGWLGSILSKETNDEKYAEMEVRSLTGAGAERADVPIPH